MKNGISSVFLSASLILMVLFLFAAGCSSAQTSPQPSPSASTAAATPAPAATEAVQPAATSQATPLPAVTTAAAAVPTTAAPSTLSVTVNSAEKRTKLGTVNANTGNIFLIVDVTLKNNDLSNDFEYTDASFVIVDKKNQAKRSAITSKTSYTLTSPLSTGKVIMKSEKSGQIVFGVAEGPQNMYQLNIIGPDGKQVATVDNIRVV